MVYDLIKGINIRILVMASKGTILFFINSSISNFVRISSVGQDRVVTELKTWIQLAN